MITCKRCSTFKMIHSKLEKEELTNIELSRLIKGRSRTTLLLYLKELVDNGYIGQKVATKKKGKRVPRKYFIIKEWRTE